MATAASDSTITLMAHLFRRAGFGAVRAELEEYVANGYEATVEALLHPSDCIGMPDDLVRRYHPDEAELRIIDSAGAYWMYRLATTRCPLQEKMTLFWHGLFATGEPKVQQGRTLTTQIDMFRRHGLGSFQRLLVELSRDPAMIFWLDNNDNHDGAINENYGRELLEFFSMGIGNYSEADIKEASRAFTGWTLQNEEYMSLRTHKASIWPYGKIAWQFEYHPEDHDDGSKTFLGQTGRFNGEDIIEIIVGQEAAARFLCTRLYQFFVSDDVEREGEELIERMMEAYFDSRYEVRSVLRAMFNSDHFKSDAVRFRRYKSPVELVAGTLHLAQAVQWPGLHVREASLAASYMGQELLNPPSVEGWHEGAEWIDSGALVERVNFAAGQLGDVGNPGVRSIIEALASSNGGVLAPEDVVDGCLDLVGPLAVDESTRQALVASVAQAGDVDTRTDSGAGRVAGLLALIASTAEYQLA